MGKKQPKGSSPHERFKKPTNKLVERQNEIRSRLADLKERNPRYCLLDIGADGSCPEMPPEWREMQKLESENWEIAKQLNPDLPDIDDIDEWWTRSLDAISEERQHGATGDRLAANRNRAEPSRRQKPVRGEPEVAKRVSLVGSNPNAAAKEMCEIFDRDNVPLPAKWLEAGLKTWSQAYRNSDYRSGIHTLISKDRRKN